MITTILLDYGKVLAYPTSGEWLLPKNARKIIGNANALKLFAHEKRFGEAYKSANDFLNGNHLVLTEAEEFAQFSEMYRRFFAAMDVRIADAVCEKLARDYVYNDDETTFYDDAISGIRRLKERYRVAVLSDNWPSLRRRLQNAGVAQLLDALIISSEHNETKEGTRLFEIAIDALGEVPSHILFVDDAEDNLKNAEKTGMNPVLMVRGDKAVLSRFPVIHSLREIDELAESANIL